MGYSGEWWVRVLQEAEVLGPELGTAPPPIFLQGSTGSTSTETFKVNRP